MAIILDTGTSSLVPSQALGTPTDAATPVLHNAGPQTPSDTPATFDDGARLDENADVVFDAGGYAIGDTSASGREAAASMIHEQRWGHSDMSTQAHYFNEQIEAHKDDAEWLSEYFAALGDDRVGDLMRLSITATANPSAYGGIGGGGNDAAVAYYQSTVDNLRTALDTLARDGYLTQADMTALYKDLDLDTSDGNVFGPTLVSDLFANSSPEVQELFFNAAMAEGNENSAAIASHVLLHMPVQDQTRILGGMSQAELDRFVEMSMQGQFEGIDLRKYFGEGDSHSTVTIGGISGILANANDVTVYYHAQIVVPDYPPELQKALFDATASALTNEDVFAKFADDAQFKDELGALALKEHDDFLDRALNADGGPNGEDLGSTTRDEYSKVLEMTLFTPPLSDSAEALMRHIDDRYQAIGDDLRTMDDAAFEDKYGRNRGAMAAAYGQMTGVFFEALDAGLTRVKDDADKAAEIMDPLFKLIDFGVGKGLDKAGPIGAVVSQALDLTGASDAAKEAIQEKIRDGHIEEAIQDMMDHGVDLSELGEELYEHMSDNVLPNRTDPNGTYQGPNGDVSIKDAWQNGYDFVQGAPTTN
ncbi:hypothetical protein FZO89_00835 [Luteimonas viscosa]|uniref:Uncharacterized protein n=1 Tax=Luteimonas viscosa TaxID=1132694 RepID=A0A5D4XQD7_9GAMM|nr:hypothetical protein [Luteimonas viscosa]TYT24940.1 hypothetical protein FZO89_00835 [Luteimonas viscosa]